MFSSFSSFATENQNLKMKKISELFKKVNNTLTVKQTENYALYTIQAAEKFKQDPYVIAAIIIHESTVRNNAVSKGGDYGLMQVRWEVHKKNLMKKFPNIKKSSDMFDAKTNILYGTELFAECMSKSNDLKSGLLRYSGGSEKLASKVLNTLKELKN